MTYEINFRAGEYLVKPDKWETPHLMEHLLLGANIQIPKARDFHASLKKTVLIITPQPMSTRLVMRPNVRILSGTEF